jgi:tetratricopeptide (TPR) repeat protein
MPADPNRAQAVFLLAVEAPDPAAREALLARECAGDDDLRARVAALLDAHDRSGDFLLAPAAGAGGKAVAVPAAAPEVPIVADRYRLVQLLGEGGMGAVWLAEQREPVRRSVAVKLIKTGMDSRAVLARFEAERQALALMDHPNIAKVLDGGTTDAGRPYFVMELVRGVALTDYCDSRQMPVDRRLSLFEQVCAAVQHAHQKGVIHRDLKPSNILVAEDEGRPVPKVIDFGLAKALGGSRRLTDASLITAVGAVVGTPLYMAPEQVGVNLLDVDTRADVYALGVILYELLTGTTPLERERLRTAAWDEVRRVIREEDPPRPSTRLSSTDARASIAAQRDTEPARLNRLVRGDLDWIVMKALEKDRNRRYETAQSLAQDVHRYLAGEAVEASPPGRTYRLRKFARRNRGAVSAAGLLLLSLVAGLVGTSWGLVRTERARAAEVVERTAAEAARVRETERADAEARALREAAVQRDRAVEAEKQARLEADTATAIRRFLQHDLLQAANPADRSEGDADLKMRDVLRRAARSIPGRFLDQPLVEAAVRTTLGNALTALGAPAEALPHLERALALNRSQHGPTHPDTLAAMNHLSVALWYAGPGGEAVAHAQQSLERHREAAGPEAPSTLDAQMILGVMYIHRDDPHKAVPVLQECRQHQIRLLGADDERTLRTTVHLAGALWKADEPAEAARLYDDLRIQCSAALGADNPLTLLTAYSLANIDLVRDRTPAAIELAEDCLRRQTRRLGADHFDTLRTQHLLAGAYLADGQFGKAVPLLEQCLEYRTAKQATQHPATTAVFRDLAWAYVDLKQPEKAIALSRRFLDLTRGRKPLLEGEVAGALMPLGRALSAIGKAAEAEPLLRECLAIRERAQPGSWPLATAEAALGATLLELKRYEEAERRLRAGFDGMRDRSRGLVPGQVRLRLAETASHLVRLYEATGRTEDAARWREVVTADGR